MAPTSDDRPQLPCESDRWRAPRSWGGGGWQAARTHQRFLPRRDPERGDTPSPSPDGKWGKGRLAVGKSTQSGVQGQGTSPARRAVTQRHPLPFSEPHLPHLGNGHGAAAGSLAMLQGRLAATPGEMCPGPHFSLGVRQGRDTWAVPTVGCGPALLGIWRGQGSLGVLDKAC